MTVSTAPEVYTHRACRVCKADLQEVLNLGNHRLNAFPRHAYEIELIPRVPLILCVCTSCGLVQLSHTVPPDWLYRRYWYRSGVNEMMIHELQDIVRDARSLVTLRLGDHVLDIGANDGTLLANYEPRTVVRYAVEPALNLATQLDAHCETRITDYFPTHALDRCAGWFKVVTAIACVYDVEDPCAFFSAIRSLLTPDGIAIVQFQDFGQQLEATAFDNICHEHLEYYTLHSLLYIVAQAGLRIDRVTQTPINGGSLRVVLRREESAAPVINPQSVVAQLSREYRQRLASSIIQSRDYSAFVRFVTQVTQVKTQIRAVLEQAFDAGTTVDVYGASTKGNVLLQVLGIGPSQIRRAIDRSPEKEGSMTITGIPIVGETEGREDPAPMWLSPIWQFRESVLARERWFLEQGGTIVFPLPQVEIVRRTWGV